MCDGPNKEEEKKSIEKERLLKNVGMHEDLNNPHKVTALHLAVFKQDKDLVEKLLEAGHNPNVPDARGIFPIHIAIMKKDFDILDLLISHGALIIDFPDSSKSPQNLQEADKRS
jgi:ankyrin repeat protein